VARQDERGAQEEMMVCTYLIFSSLRLSTTSPQYHSYRGSPITSPSSSSNPPPTRRKPVLSKGGRVPYDKRPACGSSKSIDILYECQGKRMGGYEGIAMKLQADRDIKGYPGISSRNMKGYGVETRTRQGIYRYAKSVSRHPRAFSVSTLSTSTTGLRMDQAASA